MKKSEVIKAHQFSNNNKDILSNDKLCGCFYCLKIFSPTEINEWVDENKTAICPYCGIDSIISEGSKFPITKEFLKEMNDYWF